VAFITSSLNCSRNSQHLIQAPGPLSGSQEIATGPCLEADASTPRPQPYFPSPICFYAPISTVLVWFSEQNSVYTSHSPCELQQGPHIICFPMITDEDGLRNYILHYAVFFIVLVFFQSSVSSKHSLYALFLTILNLFSFPGLRISLSSE
jgi:hypothetical protein